MALQRLKFLCSGVKNPKRRFRYTANHEDEVIRISFSMMLFVYETIRVAILNAVLRVVQCFTKGLEVSGVAICNTVLRLTLSIRGLEARQLIRENDYVPVEEEWENDEVLAAEDDEHPHVNPDHGSATKIKKMMPKANNNLVASISQVMTAILMCNLKEGEEHVIKTTIICLCLSLFSNFVVMLQSEGGNYEAYCLHIFCGSTFTLMLCGFFLLLLSSANYAFLAICPVVALIIIFSLFNLSSRFGHAQTELNYEGHLGKLKYYSAFSLDVANATLTGLSTCIFSSPTIPHQNGEVKPTECFLYITVFTSLLLMQLSSVPPSVSHHTMAARMMEYMKYLFYVIVGLLFLVVQLAVGAVLGGEISILICITVAMILVVHTIINKNVQLFPTNESLEKAKLDLKAMVVVNFILNILVVVYTKYVDDRTKVDDRFFQLMVSMLCSCIAFITSLSKVLLISDGKVYIIISCVFAFAAIASSFLAL